MARTPKIQSSPEAAVPTRRGRKPKAAVPSPALPLAADVGDPAADDARTDVPQASPTKALGRRGPGRKPKQAVGAEMTLAVPDDSVGSQDQASPHSEARANSGLTEGNAPAIAAVSQAETAADSDPVQSNFDSSSPGKEAALSFPETGVSAPAGPAAHWDRTTDRVQFDWPAIEMTAAQDGPNQGMAKLLVAARAEGARSRWPF